MERYTRDLQVSQVNMGWKETNLEEHAQKQGEGEGGKGGGDAGVGDGDVLANEGGAQEESPEGGEGKASQGGDEGHRAREIHVAVEHGRLEKRQLLTNIKRQFLYKPRNLTGILQESFPAGEDQVAHSLFPVGASQGGRPTEASP